MVSSGFTFADSTKRQSKTVFPHSQPQIPRHGWKILFDIQLVESSDKIQGLTVIKFGETQKLYEGFQLPKE